MSDLELYRCGICQLYGCQPACVKCQKLTAAERDKKLTDTIIAELDIEEKNKERE